MQNIRVEVTDKDGWRKEFVLQKVISQVGADAKCDIVLEPTHGSGVSSRHLQIINGSTCRLVNIGTADITIATGFDPATSAPSQVRPLSQLSSIDVQIGAWIRLGDFVVRMRIPEQSATMETAAVFTQAQPAAVPSMMTQESQQVPVTTQSTYGTSTAATQSATGGATQPPPLFTPRATTTATPSPTVQPAAAPVMPNSPDVPVGDSIGLRLNMPTTVLDVDTPIEGSIVVRNSGNRPGAQFRLEIHGLTADCYELGPGPILFPNAEKEVAFKLMHSKKATPPAGDLRLIFRATAPDAYPGQVAVAIQVIQVAPVYQHSITLTATN